MKGGDIMEGTILQQKMVRYRAKHNISQSELAQKCSLSLQTISCVETGIQKPSRLTEQKILCVIEGD